MLGGGTHLRIGGDGRREPRAELSASPRKAAQRFLPDANPQRGELRLEEDQHTGQVGVVAL